MNYILYLSIMSFLDIYNNLRRSPYRNYIKEELPERYGAVYLMLIDKKEKIESLYSELEELGYTKEFKVLKYDSDDYSGYTYIKIYGPYFWQR